MLSGVRALERSIHIIGLILRVTFLPVWFMVVEKRSLDPLKTDVN